VLADEVSSLLPGHPHVASQESLASITVQGPSDHVTLSSATPGAKVLLGPGAPRLVMFFATWLSEVSDLKSELIDGNAYVAAARKDGLPPLVAVDETVVEPSAQTDRTYLASLGTPLSYPVAVDTTGRVADGYGVRTSPGWPWSPRPARSSGPMTAGSPSPPSPPPSSTPSSPSPKAPVEQQYSPRHHRDLKSHAPHG
jgi:hypothetical protein